jgi:hypothetical protein
MTTAAAPPSPAEKDALMAQVRLTLGVSPGARIRFSPIPVARGPLAVSLGFLATYCLIWAGFEAATHYGGWQSQPKLVSLLAWAGLYFTAAFFFQQSASARLFETIERDIVPHASSAYLERVTGDLERRRKSALSRHLPWIVAAASLAAAAVAVYADVKRSRSPVFVLTSPEFLLWAIAYFVCFFTAVQAVIAARFYSSFADHLAMETNSLYVLGAAESPLVVGLSRLGGQVLIFWLMLFLTIVSSMLLAAPWPGEYGFTLKSWFLRILVPVAGFFSLGFGSLVYLASEARIRAILRRFTLQRLTPVRKRSNDLFPKSAVGSPEQRAVLAGLADLHDRVVAGGKYGSRLGTVLSLALPLTLPILSIIKLLISGT